MPLTNIDYLQGNQNALLANAGEVLDLINCEKSGCNANWSKVVCEYQIIRASNWFIKNQIYDSLNALYFYNELQKIIGLTDINYIGIDPNLQLGGLTNIINSNGSINVDLSAINAELVVLTAQITANKQIADQNYVSLQTILNNQNQVINNLSNIYVTTDQLQLIIQQIIANTGGTASNGTKTITRTASDLIPYDRNDLANTGYYLDLTSENIPNRYVSLIVQVSKTGSTVPSQTDQFYNSETKHIDNFDNALTYPNQVIIIIYTVAGAATGGGSTGVTGIIVTDPATGLFYDVIASQTSGGVTVDLLPNNTSTQTQNDIITDPDTNIQYHLYAEIVNGNIVPRLQPVI